MPRPVMSSLVHRQPSHASSSTNPGSTLSPKARRSFFRKKLTGKDEAGSSDRAYESHDHDRLVGTLFGLPETEASIKATRSHGSLPSPDPFLFATHDVDFVRLQRNIGRIRKASQDPKKMDHAWEVYKVLKEECYQMCKSLIQKSQASSRNASAASEISPLDTRSSYSGSTTEVTPLFRVNDLWLAGIEEYKAAQTAMLDCLHSFLLGVLREYQPDISEKRAEEFMTDKEFRKTFIANWREISIHKMRSEKLHFFEHYRIHSLNFHTLGQDVQAMEKLLSLATSGITENMTIREHAISKDGDTMLEFANGASEEHPVLRFRVSSHLLGAASPLFSHMFSTSHQEESIPLDFLDDYPPPPTRHVCEDKTEVNLYRMPQVEFNTNGALTILLHAAHLHKHEVPREIDFPAFVSIAEVCLRYRCLPVQLEFQVEYRWLPQWIHVTGDEASGRDGLLLISYVFGERGVFAATSKSAILNAINDAEIESKTIWPQTIRSRIQAIRAAKLAQVHACCTNAIEEYFRMPQANADRSTSVGSLTLTIPPRCPRKSHLCDATNLGWLMLVYNELRILPSIMKDAGFHDLPDSPRRSLKGLLDCLRLMPSAPEVHSGVCDYAPAFRSAINDIYNSISGLTLNDVGSFSSSHVRENSAEALDDTLSPQAHELTAESKDSCKTMSMPFNEAICLRILSCLDNIDDLNATAMVDKRIYSVYKNNEATLLKNIMRAERRRTMSMATSISRGPMSTRSHSASLPRDDDEKCLVSDNIHSAWQNGFHEVRPLRLPVKPIQGSMSHAEAQMILWPDDVAGEQSTPQSSEPVDDNEKFLKGGGPNIEDKARLDESYKHLRDDKDATLGLGKHKRRPPS